MLRILTRKRIDNFWQLARKWFKWQFTAVEDKVDAVGAKILDVCTDEDIDRMFSSTTTDGQIIVPAGLIANDGTMPVSVFKAITGLTPVN